MAGIPMRRFHISTLWFDHINTLDHTNWDGRCPHLDKALQTIHDKTIEMDQDSMSWLLSQILDRPDFIGTRQLVSNRRRLIRMAEYMYVSYRCGVRIKSITGGSKGDGFDMQNSDVDIMYIDPNVIVLHPDQYHLLPEDSRDKTVLFMRDADCQSGYVALELGHRGSLHSLPFHRAIVNDGNSSFISSDLFRKVFMGMESEIRRRDTVDIVERTSNGPCSTSTLGKISMDNTYSFPCLCWPKEAEEWVHRTRLFEWPDQVLRDKIVQNDCHVVPVGDRCSQNTSLQWRISFLSAERLLVHSLSHQQFRIYGLLKYFLKQLKDILEKVTGDSDILCSYHMKTLIFHAVENSPSTLWQEKNTFVCFRFCLGILIDWIKKANCPNYFILDNNLFKRKVHGENQQKLVHLLTDIYCTKWSSLSVGTVFQPSICQHLQHAVHGELSHIYLSNRARERLRDMDLYPTCFEQIGTNMENYSMMSKLRLLSESQSNIDEFISYWFIVTMLGRTAMSTFTERKHSGTNKQKYMELRKCRRLLTPIAAMCTSPGLLYLATFHYHTGNYKKSLEMCEEMISSGKCYVGGGMEESKHLDSYEHPYCGRGYSLFHKLKEGCVFCLAFFNDAASFWLPHLHIEETNSPSVLVIPPLPYALFLSFLCHHDLGDSRRRDATLLQLRAANYDTEQGGHKHSVVHTLLGICYQTVGDNRRAIQAYMDSVHVDPEGNPAIERIEALRRSQ